MYMKIQQYNNQQSFTSRLNPVKPFQINTKLGKLNFSEIKVKELPKGNQLDEIADFFCTNFASFTNDPYWLAYRSKKNKDYIRNGFVSYIKPKIKYDDGSFTMLAGRDEKGKLRAACISYSFDEVPLAAANTLYVDSLAVDKKFRGLGLGKTMLEKTIDINKNTFTDVFLKGEVKATGFYEKMGFEKMTPDNLRQRQVIEVIAAHGDGDGYPDYVHFFTKHLQQDKPLWYEIINKLVFRR